MRTLGRILVVSLFSLCSGFGAESACLGKIVSITSQRPIFYNPFSPTNSQTNVTLKVQNTGSSQCAYQLSIPALYYPLQLGGNLNFDLISSGISANGASNTFSVSTGPIPPGKTASVSAILRISRGQSAESGVLSRTIGFTLAQAGASGTPPPLDQLELTLRCTIPALFEINIAGSGHRKTIDFGELTPNAKRTVVLQTRSTQDHKIEFTSEHRGYLVREGSLGDAISKVPYTLSIDGQAVATSGDTFLEFKTNSRETSHIMTVTLGDSRNKMAGTYKDVIMIHISHLL